MSVPNDQDRFQCPGEPGTIGRAVHLARLTDGYPACRHCRYRDDVEGLSDRLKQRLPSAQASGKPADFVCNEGLLGNLHEGFDPIMVGRFAAGFGLFLREEREATTAYPTVVFAGDGRPVTQRHYAKVIEQLRWAGCDVVDLGSLPCPALSWAIGELVADGGLYLGNPAGDPHKAGVRFYRDAGTPLTEHTALEAISDWAESEPCRPVRVAGTASRPESLPAYESRFTDSYHGLRPLRFLLHTTCPPVGACLVRLLRETACKMVLRESETCLPHEQLSESGGHFAASIDDDGRRCHLWDERGTPVPFERLMQLIAKIVCGTEPSDRRIVVDQRLLVSLRPRFQQAGLTLHGCGRLSSELFGAMVSEEAALGADQHGRLWYRESNGRVIADALGTLTLVLGKLSDGDRSLSEVLDDEVPGY